MKRSILLSLMFIGAIVGVLGFTAAQFQDHEQVNAELTAGTLDLTVGDGTTFASALYNCVLVPVVGSPNQFTCDFSLKNEGSLPAELWVLMAHTTTACTGPGEFCNEAADITADNVFVDEEVDGSNLGFWDVPWSNFEAAECQTIRSNPAGSHLTSWSAGGVSPAVVAPGAVVDLHYVFKLAGTAGVGTPLPSLAQGDSITLTFHYTMLEAGVGVTLSSAPCLLADS